MGRLVRQWRASGGSRASFARRHRIPTWTFWYWCHKLANEAPAADARSAGATAFVSVRVAEATDTVLEIALSGGAQVQVRAGASAELVRAAVLALRSAC